MVKARDKPAPTHGGIISMDKTNWHALSVEEVLKKLKTTRQGLSNEEFKKRLKRFGPNKLPEEKPLSRLAIFLDQFKSPLIYILLAAGLISFLLREFIDSGVIFAAVVINTIVGFVQENKAERALSELKKMVSYKAKVLRESQELEIDSSQIVPGDIILLEAGDKILADGRLIEINNFKVNEAPLTGESIPVAKVIKKLEKDIPVIDRENMVYMGTTVLTGKARAVVTSVGVKSYFGHIASLIRGTKEEKTPLQKKIADLSKILGLGILGICSGILLIGLFAGRAFFEMFMMAVAIAVSAIPEGLLVGVTVVLTIGMQRILKHRALVRKLIAAETLGATTVICADKTGTLTQGKMQVSQILTFNEKNADFEKNQESHTLVLKIGMLCNNAVIENPDDELEKWKIHGEPTEKALLLAATQSGLSKKILEKEESRLDEIPFNEGRKFMATLHYGKRHSSHKGSPSEQSYNIYIKGAPEKILEMSSYLDVDGVREKLNPKKIKKLENKYENLAKRGLRVLAVAYTKLKIKNQKSKIEKEDLKDIIFVGFVALKDPLRKEAKEAIQSCRKAGIRPVIITGDHRLTARTIAQELGLPSDRKNILEAENLEKMSDAELRGKVKNISIYARVTPYDKLRIVDAWQAKGEVVAMTGDGINDAPALKSADIGIALGDASDAAKETSDMILLDNNFKTIVRAVEEGRVIFANIRKIILYLLSDSFSEIFIISASLILSLFIRDFPLPLLAAQILWINVITDGFPNIALTVEPKEKEIMDEPPRKKTEPLLNLEIKVLIGLISLITAVSAFGLFYLYWQGGDLEKARTITFTVLGIDSLLYIFSCRSLKHSIFQKNVFSNKYLILAVIAGGFLQLAAIYSPILQKVFRTVPLNIWDWVIILMVCFGVIVAVEAVKYIFIVRGLEKLKIKS